MDGRKGKAFRLPWTALFVRVFFVAFFVTTYAVRTSSLPFSKMCDSSPRARKNLTCLWTWLLRAR
jgi:hypothetical protein